jgi:hypothetical protein
MVISLMFYPPCHALVLAREKERGMVFNLMLARLALGGHRRQGRRHIGSLRRLFPSVRAEPVCVWRAFRGKPSF